MGDGTFPDFNQIGQLCTYIIDFRTLSIHSYRPYNNMVSGANMRKLRNVRFSFCGHEVEELVTPDPPCRRGIPLTYCDNPVENATIMRVYASLCDQCEEQGKRGVQTGLSKSGASSRIDIPKRSDKADKYERPYGAFLDDGNILESMFLSNALPRANVAPPDSWRPPVHAPPFRRKGVAPKRPPRPDEVAEELKSHFSDYDDQHDDYPDDSFERIEMDDVPPTDLQDEGTMLDFPDYGLPKEPKVEQSDAEPRAEKRSEDSKAEKREGRPTAEMRDGKPRARDPPLTADGQKKHR